MSLDRQVNYRPSADELKVLETQLSTAFNDKFAEVEQTYTRIANQVPMNERGLTLGWLSQDDDLEEFDPVVGRTARFLQAHAASVQVKKFHKTIGITFDDLRDGKFSEALLVAAGIGKSTKRHPDRLTYAVLTGNTACLYDGKALFHDEHLVNPDEPAGATFSNQDYDPLRTSPVWYIERTDSYALMFGTRTGEGYSFSMLGEGSDLAFKFERIEAGVRARVVAAGGLPHYIYRSNAPLTAENVEAAITAMAAIPGPDGQPIVNAPNLAIVPKRLRFAAKALFGSNINAAGGFNPLGGELEVLASDYL